MLVLNAVDVRRALPMGEAIAAMKEAFAALAGGRVEMPLRAQVPVKPHEGVTLVMSAFSDAPNRQALAVKVVSVYPRNRDRGLSLINASVLVLDPETGRPEGLLDGATLTSLRTGAASGVATGFLAREDANSLALLGAGVQARAQLEGVCCARSIRTVKVYDADRARAEDLICQVAGEKWSPADLSLAGSAREALAGADIVCTATTAAKPLFADSDLKPGAHINAIGSYQPHAQEIPGETVVRAKVVVDQREAALEETGDLIQPIRQKLITADHVYADLGELVLGRKQGRTSDEEITIFKSVGLAVQDAVAGQAALDGARRMGLGKELDL